MIFHSKFYIYELGKSKQIYLGSDLWGHFYGAIGVISLVFTAVYTYLLFLLKKAQKRFEDLLSRDFMSFNL